MGAKLLNHSLRCVTWVYVLLLGLKTTHLVSFWIFAGNYDEKHRVYLSFGFISRSFKSEKNPTLRMAVTERLVWVCAELI